MSVRVAVVGARGYTGRELCGILARHPEVELVYAASAQAANTPLATLWPELASALGASTGLEFVAPTPRGVVDSAPDVVFLALPNGTSAPYVEALANNDDVVVIDLSADFRFDAAWTYGLVERNRQHLRGAKRISNPGCYATGMQLAIAPFLDVMGPEAPRVFGVSGYSGAGTTPSEKNDVDVLRDNLLAYSLLGHIHEREVSHHFVHPVRFTPHVASWFRGIHLTVDLSFTKVLSTDSMVAHLENAYRNEALVEVTREIPRVRDIVGRPGVVVGGAVAHPDEPRGVVVATIDNLAKGAATQAVQNMNLALGLDEYCALLAM